MLNIGVSAAKVGLAQQLYKLLYGFEFNQFTGDANGLPLRMRLTEALSNGLVSAIFQLNTLVGLSCMGGKAIHDGRATDF